MELSHLKLDSNVLTGTISHTLENLRNISEIDLWYNQITGELIDVIDLQELTALKVNQN